MEFVYSLGRFPTDVLDHTILKYIYSGVISVIHAGDLFVLKRRIFPFPSIGGATMSILGEALAYGRLECLKWLYAQEGPLHTTWSLDKAARNGHLDCMKWIHEKGFASATQWAMDWAASNGHLDCMKWLKDVMDIKGTLDTMNWAAERGHLHVVKWLHEQGVRHTLETMINAMSFGHYHIIDWLKGVEAAPPSGTCRLSKSKKSKLDYYEAQYFHMKCVSTNAANATKFLPFPAKASSACLKHFAQ